VKILVTAKRVEDPESKIKVKADGSGIVQEGLKYKINPFDEIAVEEALRLSAKHGGEVVVASIGTKDVQEQLRHALAMGAVDTLLISEGLRKKRVTIKCPQCNWQGQLTVDKEEDARCPACPTVTPTIESSADFVDALYDDAEKVGTRVELLSVDSEEGETLMKAFGGIAAILRYGIGGQ